MFIYRRRFPPPMGGGFQPGNLVKWIRMEDGDLAWKENDLAIVLSYDEDDGTYTVRFMDGDVMDDVVHGELELVA